VSPIEGDGLLGVSLPDPGTDRDGVSSAMFIVL
jgi:hypothetical protein